MRSAQDIRTALVGLLEAGAEGDFAALAACIDVAPYCAQVALGNLRREGRVVVRRKFAPVGPSLRGRPRVVYALADRNTREAHHQALEHAFAAWGRNPGADAEKNSSQGVA